LSAVADAAARRARPPLLDPPTTAVMLVMLVGFPLLVVAHHRGFVAGWVAVVVGTVLMNLSFTAWHEPAHGNFSRSSRVNHVAGWLTSFGSVYPGYFARRREHLIHHKYQGVPGMDPVYARIQATFWTFPLRVLRSNLTGPTTAVPQSFVRLSRGQKAADAVSNGAVLVVLAASGLLGFWPSLLLAWIVPRAVVFWIHAYYVCFFPHSVPGGGYRVYRVRPSAWLPFATMGQNLHGLHHRYPSIPWHAYRAAWSRLGADEAREIEVLDAVSPPVRDAPTDARRF
jgi:beta-carotene hydroxylase